MDVCQVCVKQSTDLQDIEPHRFNFYEITGILANDGSMLCGDCIWRLEIAILFRKQALKSFQFLEVTPNIEENILIKEEVYDEPLIDIKQENFDVNVVIDEVTNLNPVVMLERIKIESNTSINLKSKPKSKVKIKECPYCFKTNFLSLMSKELHIKKHILKANGLRCELCGQKSAKYRSRGGLEHHMRSVHLKEKIVARNAKPCPKCGAKVGDIPRHLRDVHRLNYWVKKHKLKEHGLAADRTENSLKIKECPYCFKTDFETISLKNEHIKQHIIEANGLRCELCGQKSAKYHSRSGLEHHMRTMHLREKIVAKNARPCPKCGTKVGNIPRHLREVHQMNFWVKGKKIKEPGDDLTDSPVKVIRYPYGFKTDLEQVNDELCGQKSIEYNSRDGCPKCGAKVRNIPRHLREVHLMNIPVKEKKIKEHGDDLTDSPVTVIRYPYGFETDLEKVNDELCGQKLIEYNARDGCPKCGAKVGNIPRHLREVHQLSFWVKKKEHDLTENSLKIKECPYCFKTDFETVRLKNQHIKQHIIEADGLRCELCGQKSIKYRSRVGLEHHIRAVHLKEKRVAKSAKACHLCGALVGHLKRHLLLIHQIGDPLLYQCDLCNETFRKKVKLRKHIRIDHLKQTECDICHKKYVDYHALKLHRLTHDNIRQYVCPICHKAVSQRGNLLEHIARHDPSCKYLCDICGRLFRSNFILKHRESHEPIKESNKILPYQCTICNMRFKQRYLVLNHMSTHTDKKEFSCKYCDKCFKTKAILKMHERFHTGDHMFSCTVCDKQFNSQYRLKFHVKVDHCGLRYDCDICGSSFSRPFTLSQHKLKHHPQ